MGALPPTSREPSGCRVMVALLLAVALTNFTASHFGFAANDFSHAGMRAGIVLTWAARASWRALASAFIVS